MPSSLLSLIIGIASRFLSLPRFPHLSARIPIFATQLRLMADKIPDEDSTTTVRFSPAVDKLQEFINSDPSGGWERCWEEGLTPWDLGQPTPILQHLLQTESLPTGRALVPGCGSGYDVVTLASPERHVIGLDISEVAIKKARELASSSPNAKYISFLLEDFFTWKPSELFDLIFDYTFFCAIEPNLRSAWGSLMGELLKPDGELITLMFPIDDHDGGPPYKTSISDYEQALHPLGFKAITIVENQLSVSRRKGREKLGRWRRMTMPSPL